LSYTAPIQKYRKGTKIMKCYGKGDRLYVQAQQIWSILTSVSSLKVDYSDLGKGLITYGDLATLMGKPDNAARTLSRQLGIVGYYCLDNDLPALNAIVINKNTGAPGHDVVLTGANSTKKEQKKIRKINWFQFRAPSISKLRSIYEEYM
jgi:alkylated DNA nucleotide flippase Atl1